MIRSLGEPQRHRDTESRTEEIFLVAKPTSAGGWRLGDFQNLGIISGVSMKPDVVKN